MKIIINENSEIEDEIELLNVKSESSQLMNENQPAKSPTDSKKTLINLKSWNDCIEKINSQPSRLNGMCCYYLNDYHDCITSANISPNTEMIAVSNENSSIHLYKLNERKTNKKRIENSSKYHELIGGHSSAVFKSKFTHDSKYLLTCGDDKIVCLWNLNKIKDRNQAEQEEEEEEDDGSFEAKLKSSLSSTSTINTSLVTSYSGHLYSVWDLELYSQLNFFATASKDATARLWSFDRMYPLRIFAGHQSDVNCVKFHPNGAYLATGSSDKTVRLWSVSTGEFVRLFSGHRSRVFSLAFSPDGSYLASAGEDKKIKIYDLRSGLIFKEFKGHTDTVHTLSFDNNSEILCSGGLDKTVKFWDFQQKNIKIGPEILSEQNSLNKNTSSPANSNELIRSINLDFNVYSIYCDMQNVFHVNGAKKLTSSPLINRNLMSQSDDNAVLKPNIKSEKTSEISLKAKRIVSKAKTLPGEKLLALNQQVVQSKSSINTRSRRNEPESLNNVSTAIPSTAVNSNSFLFNNDDDLYEV